jgi:hypothetical protein
MVMKPIQINGCEHYTINQEGVVVNTQTGRVLKTDLSNCGYKRVTLWSKDQKRVRISIHRLVAIHYVENLDNLPMVNHLDGNKLNNHKSNLEWCTCKSNTIHAFTTGLMKDTKKYISLDLAQQLKDEHRAGKARKDLVVEYGVPKHVMDNVLYRNETYKYIK